MWPELQAETETKHSNQVSQWPSIPAALHMALYCTQHKRDKLATNAAFHIHHKWQCAENKKEMQIVIHCQQTPQPEVQQCDARCHICILLKNLA